MVNRGCAFRGIYECLPYMNKHPEVFVGVVVNIRLLLESELVDKKIECLDDTK